MAAGEPKIKIEMWPIESVIPYELNAKKHEGDQVTRIVRAIQAHGWDVPIVVDKYGVIIKGHGRRLAAIELGMPKVPVIVRTDLTPAQVREARLADNRVALSDIDPELLRQELADLGEFESLEGIFDAKELTFMGADLGEINPGMFESDMGAVLEEQRADLGSRAEAAVSDAKRVPLTKAFGFKDVSAAGLRAISALMAHAEATTGLTQDAALVAFGEKLA